MTCSIRFGDLLFEINGKGDVTVYYLNRHCSWEKADKLSRKDMELLLNFYKTAIIKKEERG